MLPRRESSTSAGKVSAGICACASAQDGIGAVANAMPDEAADFAFVEAGVGFVPVHEARLGFHDPGVLALDATGEIEHGTGADGIEVVPAEIGVPRDEIEFPADAGPVEVRVIVGVVGDPLAGLGVGADGVELDALKLPVHVRHEQLAGMEQTWVLPAVPGRDL